MNDYVKELLQSIDGKIKKEQTPILEFNKKAIKETEEAYNDIFKRIIENYQEKKIYSTEEEFNELIKEKYMIGESIFLPLERFYKSFNINMDYPYVIDNSNVLEKYLKFEDNHGNNKTKRYSFYHMVYEQNKDLLVDLELLKTLFTNDGFTFTLKDVNRNLTLYVEMELDKFEQLIKDNTMKKNKDM